MTQSAQDIKRLANGRPYEEYILQQWNWFSSSDYYSDHKRRLEDFDLLYRGEWDTFARGIPKPEFASTRPLIQNAVKEAIHDISGLAHAATASTTFIARGDTEKDETASLIRDSVADTLYEVGGGADIERKLYMDALDSGIMAVAVSYNKQDDYPCYNRLNPRYCYPDIRDGKLQNMLYIEVIKTREIKNLFPDVDWEVPAGVDEKCRLVDYYDDDCVTKAIIFTRGGRNASKADDVKIVKQWEHELECVPVAFAQADTADGAMRGHFDQAGTALVARSHVIGFLLEYIESMVHAPFEEKNIRNAGVTPGPFVVYHHDRTEQESFMRRVQPAAPSGAVFGVVQILNDETNNEISQPPARQGQVSQSQASAAFVASTQGSLTQVVQELQAVMARLRKRLNIIGFKVDERWCDKEKPLIRPVGKVKTYTPSKAIDGWYYHTVQFGVASGISRDAANVLILQHVGAKFISKKEARKQLDYVANPTAMQNEIDQEAVQDAALQRMVTDPRIPPSLVLKMSSLMKKEGLSFDDASERIMEDLQKAEQAAQEQGAPNALPGAPAATEPGEENLALEKGGLDEFSGGQSVKGQPVEFAPAPFQTNFVGRA